MVSGIYFCRLNKEYRYNFYENDLDQQEPDEGHRAQQPNIVTKITKMWTIVHMYIF